MLILIGVAFIIFLIIGIYNSLVSKKARIEEAWSTINTQLKRRYDLIPNLVEIVKGYAKHENETLENIVKARKSAMETSKNSNPAEMSKIENTLTGQLGKIFALSENYPDLKANTNFLELQQEISDTENKIQATRQFYNTCVLSFNTVIKTFPTNIIASLMHFTDEKYFELDEKEAVKTAPSIKF
jgi:LemA protein